MNPIQTITEELPYMVIVGSLSIGNVTKSEPYIWSLEHLGLELFPHSSNPCYEYNPYGKWDFTRTDTRSIRFHFRHQEDALLFKLTWGGE